MTIFFMILFTVIFTVILSLIIFNCLKFSITIKTFREYLLSIGDEKTSQWFGWLSRLIIEVELRMEKKYEETKNGSYLAFSDRYRELVTSITFK